MEYKANSGVWGTMFGVPFVVADNFLKLATGQQLKVLLYLLRCSGRSCSDDEISRNTGVSPQEAAEAVLFWQQVNVITPQNLPQESVVPVSGIMSEQPPAPAAQPEAAVSTDKPKPAVHQRENLAPSEISKLMKDSSDISELFKVAESALGPLSHTQQNSIIWMYSYLGLKREVIVTLLFYCRDIDKTNPGYIEKIAYSWAEKDINTINAAQDEVERMNTSNDFTGEIMKIFEMSKSPTPKQSGFIEQWRTSGFSIELIKLAYEKTLDNINKLSFDYINKILISWKNSGFTTVDQVAADEESFRKKKASGSQNTVDPDIEKYKIVMNKF